MQHWISTKQGFPFKTHYKCLPKPYVQQYDHVWSGLWNTAKSVATTSHENIQVIISLKQCSVCPRVQAANSPRHLTTNRVQTQHGVGRGAGELVGGSTHSLTLTHKWPATSQWHQCFACWPSSRAQEFDYWARIRPECPLSVSALSLGHKTFPNVPNGHWPHPCKTALKVLSQGDSSPEKRATSKG